MVVFSLVISGCEEQVLQQQADEDQPDSSAQGRCANEHGSSPDQQSLTAFIFMYIFLFALLSFEIFGRNVISFLTICKIGLF